MKKLHCLWLLLLALLLSGCVAESSVPVENTPEYQAGYEQAQTDMEDSAAEHPASALEAFPEEMERAYSNGRDDGYMEGYTNGYLDAKAGKEPEFDIEDTPEPEPAEEITAPLDEDVGEEVDSEAVNYIANKNTGKFHYPDCPSVDEMKEKNKLYWTGSRDELTDQGYVPCKRCNP